MKYLGSFYHVTSEVKQILTRVASLERNASTNIPSVSDLLAWTLAASYSVTSATRDSDGVITTATVSWPDASTGTFTRTTKNNTFLTIDAYTVTHTSSGKTITQPAVTRDSNGNVTAQPALTIA